jgi:hypothetical protein
MQTVEVPAILQDQEKDDTLLRSYRLRVVGPGLPHVESLRQDEGALLCDDEAGDYIHTLLNAPPA